MNAGPWVLRNRFRLTILVSLALVLALHLTWAVGQTTYNEREVKSEPSALDDPKLDVWSLDFRFKDPRLIKVNVPARGTRICWYLWYQVINRTKEPRTFIPDFELVTLDHPASYHDEVLPSVEDAIRKVEDPTGYQDIKNSVTIASKPIPVSQPADKAFARAVTGVAIWDGTPDLDPEKPWKDNRPEGTKDISDSNRFKIFVSGLSNGWVLVDPVVKGKAEAPLIRRKTLQLNFKRVGDRYSVDSREISFVPPSEWIYRSARLRIPGLDAEPGKEKELDKMGLNQFQLPGNAPQLK
jgi:hypothetical protein